jgi:hypothetical protein
MSQVRKGHIQEEKTLLNIIVPKNELAQKKCLE